ncbi:hypothetical protein Gohar_004113 [Gossypium harknessii]|uniref:Uncharacterized protein n=1 Tax=Gossypium harknessii TaxID=34285 RepID=A0A7J9H438_9ROSI|nr:hypothetical protein [Gossypium harknessii]
MYCFGVAFFDLRHTSNQGGPGGRGSAQMLEEAKWSKPDVAKKGGGATKSCWRKASHVPGLRPTKEERQGADFILVKE